MKLGCQCDVCDEEDCDCVCHDEEEYVEDDEVTFET